MKLSDSLAIIGGGDSECSIPDNIEVWGQNNVYTSQNHKYTRYFEIHPFMSSPNGWLRKGQKTWREKSIDTYISEVNALSIPVYTQTIENNPFTHAIPLPLEDLLKNYRRFFDTTIAYMLGLAGLEGFKKIYLCGIDMCTKLEHQLQKASVTYLCGLLEGRGVEIITSLDSPLLESDALYAFGTNRRSLWRQRVDAMRQYIQKERARHHDMLQQYIGAENCLENMTDFYTTLIKEKLS